MIEAKDEVRYLRRTKGLLGILFLAAVLLAGCGSNKAGTVVTGAHYYQLETENGSEEVSENNEQMETEAVYGTESLEDESNIGADLYMIISNDMNMEHMILEQLTSGRQYMYYYSLTTRFLDKYGDNTTVSEFEPGKIVNVGEKDSEGRLLEMEISDSVWEYEDITRYSVDEERGIFKIADVNYSYDEDVYVVSNGEKIRLSALTEMDEIRVIGMEKKILSVVVTSGHGELAMENTALFEGSYVQIGNEIFAEVTANMELELQEGTYLVTVANNGYGGSKEVTIERGQTTTLNLDELKGEGPKKGKILFAVDTEDAELWVDGKKKDYSEPLELQYGVHSIKVSAAGYEDYSKKLFVNSEEATILVEMTGSSTATASSETNSETSTEANTQASSETAANSNGTADAGSLAGSLAGSGATGTGTSSSTSATDAAAQTNSAADTSSSVADALTDALTGSSSSTGSTDSDYLSTLSELLKVLTE